MARRTPAPSRRSPGRRNPVRNVAPAAPVPSPAPAPRSGDTGRPGLEARIGFAFGALAFLSLPIAYQWVFRPSSRPPGSDILVPVLELGGVLAAAAALLLGRRARAAGDRSSGAVWAPRLGGAAIVGYVLTLVIAMAQAS